jgi:chromosome segregation ATPase
MAKMLTLRNSLIALAIAVTSFVGGYLYSNHRAAIAASIALADWNARLDVSNKIISGLEAKIKERQSYEAMIEEQNKAIEEERDVLKKKLSAVSADLAYLQAHEPVQPELETQPLVINLRAQIKKGNEAFSLAVEDREKLDKQVANYKKEINWLQLDYEDAMSMYLNSKGLNDVATTKIAQLSKQNRLAKDVAMGEAVVIVVLLVLNMVK